MADTIFRREWDYLMNVFGEPTLGWYYPDYREAVRNSYGEIIGGTVYLVRQCPMRGLVLEKPLEFRQLQDGSGDTQFIGIEQAVTFKVSATDLIKGGVMAEDGSYALADNPNTAVIEGVLNHKYIIYRGQLYEVINFDRGVIFKGDPSNAYITTTRDVDYTALHGKAQLVIQDSTQEPPAETFSVTVDNQLWGMYVPGVTVVLTTPTKPGYTFKGWSSQSVTVTNNTFVMPSQNVIIQSLWEEVETPDPGTTYVVYVDGVLLGEYAPGSVVTLETPTKDGYTFSGWSSTDVTVTDNTFTMPEKDVNITSTWDAVPAPSGKYKITVVNPCTSADATLSGVYEVEPYQLEDGSWSEPALSIKSGSYYALHTFSEWRVTSGSGTFLRATSGNTVFYPTTAETTIEAVWTAVADPRHTVTFVGIDRDPEKYETGATVSCYAGLKEGYEFSKWSAVPSVTFRPRAATANVTFTMPDSDVTVTAEWAEVEYTVTFMVDGEVFATITTPPNTPIDVSEPAKEGYTFNGWYTSGGNTFNPAEGVTNDLTVTAKFTGVPRTITFNSDGGSAVESITVENGKVLGQLPTPTKDGYDFVKWTFNGEQVYATTVVTQDMTLLAVWEEVSGAGEEALIDLDSDYRLVFVNARFDFRKNQVYRTLGSGSDYTAEHFYTLKGGQATLPPDEYTTHFEQYGWPHVNGAEGEFTQPRTFGDTDQTTRVVLYRRKTTSAVPGAISTPAEVGVPTGYLSGTNLYGQVSVCCVNTSQSGNLPSDPNVTTNRLVCLTVVPTADGNFWRYEFGWVTGINNGNLLNQYSDWSSKHEGETEIPLN